MNFVTGTKNKARGKYEFFRKLTLQQNLFTPAPTFARKLPFQSGEFVRETWKEFLSAPDLPANCSLYLHIPFCSEKRCHYCMYYSTILRNPVAINAYISYIREQAAFFHEVLNNINFNSLYIGGGTPSILNPSQLSELLSIAGRFPFISAAEKTSEQSFNTSSCEKLDALLRGGINRLSFGVQSVEEEVLKAVNRSPVKSDKINLLVRHARNSGVKEINIDLMIGLPRETAGGIRKGMLTAINAGAHCVTVYVFRHLKHHMEELESREDFLTSYNADHIPEMLTVLRKTAEEQGWVDTVGNDNSEFHFFTSREHLNVYPLSGYLTRYSPEYQNSTLGLGHSAFSFIMDFFRYECRDRDMAFNPKKKSFVFDRVSGEDRRRLFVLEQLNRNGRIDLDQYKSNFGQDFEVSFQNELHELKTLGEKFQIDEYFNFKSDDRIEFAALSKFFWPASYIDDKISA